MVYLASDKSLIFSDRYKWEKWISRTWIEIISIDLSLLVYIKYEPFLKKGLFSFCAHAFLAKISWK